MLASLAGFLVVVADHDFARQALVAGVQTAAYQLLACPKKKIRKEARQKREDADKRGLPPGLPAAG